MALVGVVAWAVRAEAATQGNAKEIRRIWRQREEDLHAHREAREATNRKIDEMREEQREQMRELRSDIKALLHRDRAA
ncbi:hypothetical protein DWF04_000030 [Cereibacter sphaeroides f. sp. denitrificans]